MCRRSSGLRYDRFDLDFHNNRTGEDAAAATTTWCRRAPACVLKPVEPLSLYGSYSVSYLPSSGDQFTSLTATTETLEPEQFTNYEVGAKWDVAPDLSLTAAVYQLDRTNTAAPDPSDPDAHGADRQPAHQGLRARRDRRRDAGLAGGRRLRLSGRARSRAGPRRRAPGATVPLVPQHTLSLWNR